LIRFFVFLGSLLVIALLAALFAPPFIDWNQYKPRFEAEASRVLGLPVSVDGDTSVSLLPLPSFTFTDMKVGKTSDGAPLLTTESFTMNVELAPLLKGDVVIVDVLLEKPVFDARLDQEGNIEWPEIKTRSRIEIDQEDVALENVGISNGIVRVRDERFEREFLVRDINAKASARTLAGPWRANGTLRYAGEQARLRLSTGRWQDNQSMSIKLTAEPQSQPYDLSFDGPLKITDGAPKITGIVTIKPMSSQNDEDKITFRRPDAATALPVRVESDVSLRTSGATFPAFKMDVGAIDDPYTLTGSAEAVFDELFSLRVNAEGQQIDLKRLADDQDNSATESKLDLAARLAAVKSFLAKVPSPPTNSTVSLYLPAVIAGDTVIRDVGVDLRPLEKGNGWRLGNLEAQMPGRTDLRADGDITLGDDVNFKGELIVASRQPSGLAKWLGLEASQTIRDMSGTGFSGNVVLSSNMFSANDLELVIDGKTLKGSVLLNPDDKGESKLQLRLEGSEANIDQLDALAKLITNDTGAGFLAARNIDLNLKADRATILGSAARDVFAKLKRTRDSLEIEQLTIGNLAGADVAFSGGVENLLDNPVGKVTGKVKSRNPARFLKLINTRLGGVAGLARLIEDPALAANTDLEFALNGEQQGAGLTLSLEGRSGGSEVNASLTGISLEGGKTNSKQSFKLVLVNPEASQLMLQLGVPVVPLDQTGRAAFRVTGAGTIQDGFKTESALTLKLGYVSASGLLKPKFSGNELSFSGTLSLKGEASDLDSLILLSGLPIPGYGESSSAKLNGRLQVSDQTVELKDMKLQLQQHELAGQLAMKLDQLPRPVVSGEVSANIIDADFMRLLTQTGDVDETAGVEPKAILSGLDGKVTLRAQNITLGEKPPLKNAQVILNLSDGDMRYTALNADWLGGQLTGDLSVSQNKNSASTSGTLKLMGADAKQVLTLGNFPPKIAGKVDISFNYDASDPVRSELLKATSGGGLITVSGGSLEGINSAAFIPLLASSDGIEDRALAAAAPKIIADGVFRKSFDFGNGEYAYTVSNGQMRISSIELANDNMQLTGKASYGLIDDRAEFEGRLKFDAGTQALAGAEPEIFLSVKGSVKDLKVETDSTFFETYLGLRLNERRERAFLAQRAEILERQRLTRTARVYALRAEAERLAKIEELRLEELRIEEEKRLRAEEAERVLLEEERAQEEAERAAQEAAEEAERVALEAAEEAKRIALQERQAEELRERANRALQRLQLDLDDDLHELEGAPTNN